MPKEVNKKYKTISPILNGEIIADAVPNSEYYFEALQVAKRVLMGQLRYDWDYYSVTRMLRKNNWNINRCVNKLNTVNRPKTIGQLFEEQTSKVEASDRLSRDFKKQFAVAMRRVAGDNRCIEEYWMNDPWNRLDKSSVNRFVMTYFDWSHTAEGDDYWNDVYNRLCDVKV